MNTRLSLGSFAFASVWLVAAAAAQCAPVVLPGDPLAAVEGSLSAMATWDPDGAGPAAPVLVCGGFGYGLAAGTLSRRSLLIYDGVSWSTLGQALPGAVHAVTTFQGDLVVGGDFNDGVLSHIARWNGGAWLPVGTGCDGSVRMLAVHQNELIAGGLFSTAGSVPANRIARWNGTNWAPLGPGLTGEAVCAASFMGQLFVGGDITAAGSLPLANLAQWNGTAWIATPGVNNCVYVLAVRSGISIASSFLFAGGEFTTIGGVAADHVAQLNGATGQWTAMGAGLPARCTDIGVRSTGLSTFEVIASCASSNPAQRVARWTGSTWVGLGSFPSAPNRPPSHVVVHAGAATVATYSADVHRWSGTEWSPVIGPGIAGNVHAICAAGNDPIIGGDFATISGVTVNRVARHDGTTWVPLGPGLTGGTGVRALATMANGHVVAGGSFMAAGGSPANNIARWDGSAWQPLGSGTNGEVHALAALPGGGVVAGGSFTTAGGQLVNHVAVWNGAAWMPLSLGTDANVLSLAVLDNGDIVAGGLFTAAGGLPRARVARWNGSSWAAFGPGLPGPVYALIERADGALLAGGDFVGGGLEQLARWDGASWVSPSTSADPVHAFAELPDRAIATSRSAFIGSEKFGNVVELTPIGPVPFANVSDSSTVRAMATLPNGDLLLGGSFAGFTQGTTFVTSSKFARLRSPCPATVVASGSGCTGPAGPVVLTAQNLPWIGTTFHAAGTGLPAGFTIAVVGFQPLSLPLNPVLPEALPGCILRATPDLLSVLVPVAGAAQTSLAIPATTAAVGQSLRHQVVPFAINGSGAITSIAASNGLHLTIGVF